MHGKNNAHSVYLMYYHLIMLVKYRRKVIDNPISERAKEIWGHIAPRYGIVLEEWNHDIDHVHVMFRAQPRTELSKFINAYKSASSKYEENPDNTTSLAVILQFYLGVRPGELVALKESDVSRDYIHIQHMETSCYTEGADRKFRKTSREVVEHTKTDAGDREIPLIEKAKLVIKLAMDANERNGCSGSYLFMNQGKRITENAIACRLRKYCRHLDIPYRSPHKVRKTVISSMIDEGININTVRKIIGHEDERTTYNNYCYDRKRPEEIVSQLDCALDKNYNRKNVIDFPNGREEITEVTKEVTQNGQISDNKKRREILVK